VTYWHDPRAEAIVTDAISRMRDAESLRGAGQAREALALGRAGLELLADPSVDRENAVELTAIITLTILVEELAAELQEPGASGQDLVDTLAVLKRTGDAMSRNPEANAAAPNGWREMQAKWIPLLEARLMTR